MTKIKKDAGAAVVAISAKQQLVVNLLKQDCGATLKEIATLANWLPHSTRAFLTGLKKKGYVIESDKIEGIRRYRIMPSAT